MYFFATSLCALIVQSYNDMRALSAASAFPAALDVAVRGGACVEAEAARARACRAGQAVALSTDHKPNQERERRRIMNAGGFVTDMHGQHRVNGNLNLSRAIGDLKYKVPPRLVQVSFVAAGLLLARNRRFDLHLSCRVEPYQMLVSWQI